MAIRLGLDASQPIASCAVSSELGIITEMTMEKPIENFPALIRETLAQANVRLEEVEEIVVCIGPGSQTGVRTTVVTGNALALALGIPVSGVLSTDAGAIIASKGELFDIAVSAGRARWFVCAYNLNGDKLQRVGQIVLQDDLPKDTHPSFEADFANNDKVKSCASGLLLVVEQQQHLVLQFRMNEVLPYE